MDSAEREEPREQESPQGRGGAGHGRIRVIGEAMSRGEIASELEMDPGVVEGKATEADSARDEPLALEEEAESRGQSNRGEKKGAPPPHRLSLTKR
jgi:hypothetical protein